MKYAILFLSISLSLMACSDGQRDKLFNEVMDIHDECMPEMSTLNRIKRTIRNADIPEDSPLKNESYTIIEKIDAAEEGMMGWMRVFKIPKKDESDEKIIPYLKEEKIKIQKVSDDMYKAIDLGNTFLKQIETNN